MQLWPYQESNFFHESVHHDFHLLLTSFLKNYDLTFKNFKSCYKQLSFHTIHLQMISVRIHHEVFFQYLIQYGISLFHHPPATIETLDVVMNNYPSEVIQALWNIGVFYLLYCLYGTRLECHSTLRIRVCPEEWYEIILAYQRLKLLGHIGLQAIKIFHKLQADSAFHFSSYSGGPSLYRVAKIIEDRRLQIGDRRLDSQYLQSIVEGNEYISNNIDEIRVLILNGIHGSQGFIAPPQSLTAMDAILLGAEVPNFANMDPEMREFFGLSTHDNVAVSGTAADFPEEDEDEVEVETEDNVDHEDSEEHSDEILSTNKKFKRTRDERLDSTWSVPPPPQQQQQQQPPPSPLSLLEQLEQDTMKILTGKSSHSTNKSNGVKKTTTRKRNNIVPTTSEDLSVGNNPLSLLEQLERDAMEVLGGGEDLPPSEPKNSRKKVENNSRVMKGVSKRTAIDTLIELELETSKILENDEQSSNELSDHLTPTRGEGIERKKEKKNETSKKSRLKTTKTRVERDNHSSSTSTSEILSLLEQLERDAMEVLRQGRR